MGCREYLTADLRACSLGCEIVSFEGYQQSAKGRYLAEEVTLAESTIAESAVVEIAIDETAVVESAAAT